MRWVHFRLFLRMALHALRCPRPAPKADKPVEIEPGAIALDPDAPWLFSLHGLTFYGWRTLDASAIVPSPDGASSS